MAQKDYYSAKCVFHVNRIEDGKPIGIFEERVILLRADDFDDALRKAEDEGQRYAKQEGSVFVACLGVFIVQDPFEEGIEVFSMLRESNLSPEDYLRALDRTGMPRNSFLFQSGCGESKP